MSSAAIASFEVSVPRLLYTSQEKVTGEVDANIASPAEQLHLRRGQQWRRSDRAFYRLTARFDSAALGTRQVHCERHVRGLSRAVECGHSRRAAGRQRTRSLPLAVERCPPTHLRRSPPADGLGRAQVSSRWSPNRRPPEPSANAATLDVHYGRKIEGGSVQQRIEGKYSLRVATRALGSTYAYARHMISFKYEARSGRHVASDEFIAGAIAGQAPFFDRFVLGSSSTLGLGPLSRSTRWEAAGRPQRDRLMATGSARARSRLSTTRALSGKPTGSHALPALARRWIQTGYLCFGHGVSGSRRTHRTRVHGGHELLKKQNPARDYCLLCALAPQPGRAGSCRSSGRRLPSRLPAPPRFSAGQTSRSPQRRRFGGLYRPVDDHHYAQFPDSRRPVRGPVRPQLRHLGRAFFGHEDRPDARSRRSASHLSAQATENWCLDNLGIDRSQLPADKQFYVQLDLRAEDPKDQLGIIGDPGINLTRLIEIFGRPSRGAQPRWLMSSGPFRLDDLKKTEIRGTRG